VTAGRDTLTPVKDALRPLLALTLRRRARLSRRPIGIVFVYHAPAERHGDPRSRLVAPHGRLEFRAVGVGAADLPWLVVVALADWAAAERRRRAALGAAPDPPMYATLFQRLGPRLVARLRAH
jgi:hypothetical protein